MKITHLLGEINNMIYAPNLGMDVKVKEGERRRRWEGEEVKKMEFYLFFI